MPWSFRRDFHIDLTASYGRYLIESNLRPVIVSEIPDVIVGDLLPVRLYFWERDPETNALVAVTFAEGTTVVFSGRPAGVPDASDLLFLSTDIAATATAGVWEGTLNLNTTALHSLLQTAGTVETTLLGEVELSNATATQKQSIQFDLTARRQVYAGDEAEATVALSVPIGDIPPKVGWMKVDGANLASLNGYWTTFCSLNGKPLYYKTDDSGGDVTVMEAVPVIAGTILGYVNNRWVFALENSPFTVHYRSTADVASPDLATYEAISALAPVPGVSTWETASPPYFRTGRDENLIFNLFVHSWDADTSKRVWRKVVLENLLS